MAPLYNYTTVLRAGELDIKSARLKAGMTQKELAEALGIKGCYLTEMLYGVRPGWKYREQIEDILNLKKTV